MAGFGLGKVCHNIEYPGAGSDEPEIVDQWESVEAAPGGYVSMSGLVAAGDLDPNIYRQGATWTSYVRETSECIGKGSLLLPAVSGGVAQLAARGLAFRFDRAADRVLFQTRFYGDLATPDSDPYNLTTSQNLQTDTTGGKLAVTVQSGTAYVTGGSADVGGAVFSCVASDPSANPNSITRIAFQMVGSDTHWEWRIVTYTFPNTLVAVEGTTWQAADGVGVDYTLTNQCDMVWIQLRCKAAYTPASAKVLAITLLRINGVAVGDSFSGGQVIAEFAGRLGFSAAMIQSSSDSVLPLDVKQGTFADPCDYVDMLTDYRHLALSFNGTSDVVDFGPWDRRVWFLVDDEQPFDPIPAEIFDTVLVPYVYSPGSSVVGQLPVRLSPSPLPSPNVFADIASQQALPDSSAAQSLGQAVLRWLGVPRWSGTATISEVLDSSGSRTTAYSVRAGDTMFTKLGIPMRISGLTRKADGVQLTFDARIAALDSLLTRRQERLALNGWIG